jgi:hypothetical protein
VLALVLFSIFLICIPQLLDKELEDSSGVAVDFRLDGNLFNIGRLQATTKVFTEQVLVDNTPEDLQSILEVAVRVNSRMGLFINTTKKEVVCQWRSSPPPTMPVLTIENKSLAIVPCFKYLGSILLEGCSINLEIRNRIKLQLPSGNSDAGSSTFTLNSLSIKPSVSPQLFTALKLGSLTVTTTSILSDST